LKEEENIYMYEISALGY